MSNNKIVSYHWYSFFLRRRMLFLLVVLFLVGVVLEIWTTNRLATYGEQTAKFEESKFRLQLENQILTNEIAQKSSLLELEKQSAKLGLSRIQKIEYLNATGSATIKF